MFSAWRGALSPPRIPILKPKIWSNPGLIRRFNHTEGTQASSANTYRARKDSWYTPTILVLGFIPIFTFALGTWQLQRLQWKTALIEELEEKLQREPIILPNRVNLSAIPEFVYRRVFLRGKWDHKHTMLLGPRTREGAHGYHVVTPLVRSDGTTVLVDRGFISKDFSENYDRQEEGEIEIVGMLRTSHTRNNFTPDNRPEEGQWYWADVDGMADYAGGESANVQPVFVEEIFSGHAGDATTRSHKGIPLGRATTVDVRNAHLSYVITWYSLSVFTTAMLARLVVKRRAQKRVRPLPR
ncbi:SURF1 family-domain-containing protein [Hygrophoropsis aurantiaca]|uniref:SURF1 family-domain-containing protein n=1 Tax=Hygrophoropsis aurantiaca TaxID=72124 RepID=A0ACB8A9L7_9AGAM|nr:SURF1 family-domain-containing protein [Hygrophoropsis aurantiaca]